MSTNNSYNIDSSLLYKSLVFYQDKGYKLLSVPMLVEKDIVEMTLPKGRDARQHSESGLYYVGSAEQSFYQLIKNGFNTGGNYLMVTPCERDEHEDEHHLGIFLKVELVSTLKTEIDILSDVSYFLTKEKIESNTSKTKEGFDLLVNGIEVGSYGKRSYRGLNISFGTGLALPRISAALRGAKDA